MRLDTSKTRSAELNERQSRSDETADNLMTPARRAALDALEREFRDLLNAQARL